MLEEFSELANAENRLSCLSSGCHETAHNVAHLGNVKLWKGPQ